jgi:flagellar hook-basal body complex protein FliE
MISPIKGLPSLPQTSLEVVDNATPKKSFLDYMQEGLQSLNQEQVTADKMSTDISNGKNESIHEAMLASSHAELNFKYMVQVRNKVLEAYQDIMRMPV